VKPGASSGAIAMVETLVVNMGDLYATRAGMSRIGGGNTLWKGSTRCRERDLSGVQTEPPWRLQGSVQGLMDLIGMPLATRFGYRRTGWWYLRAE